MPTIIQGDLDTVSTNAINSSRRVIEMKDKIFLLEPSSNPLTLFVNKMRREVTRSPKFEFLEDRATPITDRVNNSGGYTAGALSIVVDNGAYFPSNSLVRVQRTGEVLHVTAVATNTLTVVRTWGTTAAAALVDNDQLTLLGGAAAENSTAETSRQTQTSNIYNYTQTVRDPFGVSRRTMKSRLYGGNALAYLHRARMIEHAKKIELQSLFGERAISGTRSSSGGVDEFVSTYSTDFGGAIGSLEEVFSASEGDFRYGSKEKFLFCGRAVASNISLLAGDVLRARESDKSFGVNISRLVSPHGVYNVISHDLFEGDTYANRALIVDMANLGYRYMPDSDAVLRTNIQSPDADGRKDEILSDVGLERVLEETHAKWTDAAS